MKVFVTGGTGAIGGHAVPALIEAGHEVTALARTSGKAAVLGSQGAKPVIVSLFDRHALGEVFAGHDAVVNLASSLPSMSRFLSAKAWAHNKRIRAEGSAAVVDAALAAGVGRVIQESVSMIYPDRGGEWITEDVPPDHYPQALGNLAAEANAHRFTEDGGTGVVLRFGWFYGPGAAHSEQLLAQARRGIGVALGRLDGYVSSIHLADAASAVVAALAVPAGTYNVVDDEPLTKRDYTAALAAATGKRQWIRGAGRAASLLGDRLTSLTRSVRVSNTAFREASGWVPRYPSAREGWLATAEALRAR
ncbi:NAD-dependent epimerase/dehydratase family protein [Amycolatopsis regifaucium]|uniref:Epimerase n=1 Tax=Amycolatopsis regifaucium TaxID=546365 RepID=A0A154MRT0_9PSEU|nr:NAD(P)-dependent oxidoreductase [Amycolatopsis regifaucium]KZB86169.1 epimerase [Amycolatopsis regifaucium]OKA05060.1 epimerase [Amycolatopsis regifaucium]SFH80563.1 Nucleoside-diphosphate-sugar epimerase [Amycolatopsis regifaucium]